MSNAQKFYLCLAVLVTLLVGCCTPAEAGRTVVVRNGVKCYRCTHPIAGRTGYSRVTYEPIPVAVDVRVEAPKAYPTEAELYRLDERAYEKALADMMVRAARTEARRKDISALRAAGVLPGERNRGKAYASSSRAQYVRPAEQQYGISVRESVDYVGADPTDALVAQIGRQQDRLGDIWERVLADQSDNVRSLVLSRVLGSERASKVAEELARARADSTRIQALASATQRKTVNREVDVTGSVLDILEDALAEQGIQTSTQAIPLNTDTTNVQQVISLRCGKCHDATKTTYQQGRLDLSNVTSLNLDEWAELVRQVSSGSMPKEGNPPVTEQERATILDAFASVLATQE